MFRVFNCFKFLAFKLNKVKSTSQFPFFSQTTFSVWYIPPINYIHSEAFVFFNNLRSNSTVNSMPSKFKYDLLAEVTADGNAQLTKYKSLNSGMTISIAQVNGPLVGGYFTFATEAHDDDGLPHTLEHLVFLGSEKYPYKGVLEMVANRCLSQGTNAWTDTDHTCYTITTAGYEGFLNILPVYLDHLLFPKLSDVAYVTEVHHITAEGDDGGVVYCEMQGRENSGISLCYRAMLCAMYPGHCGYKSETGGLLKNLRESTSNEKVRAYHKEFYRPENLCLIIIGNVEPEKVFEALIPVEERILQEGEMTKFKRPWTSPVPPLTESVTLEIEYPTDEDEFGMILTAWRGPLANNFADVISIQILLDYLTDTSVAPLYREFVEIEDPFCNDADYSVIENSETCVYLQFGSVPIAKLKELTEKLFILLKDMAEGKEEIDMQRMTNLVKKKKLYILSSMESNPHDLLANCVIGDFLYGNSVEDLESRVREIPLIDKILHEDAQYWVQFLKKYLVDSKHVVILGSPSSKLSKKISVEEKERIKLQQERLGPEGLKLREKILNEAIATNEIPPPKELITSFSVPSVKSINFHPIKRTCNVRESEGDNIQYSVRKMPCRFEVDQVETKFAHVFVMIDTSDLPLELRLYLPLLIELLDECAIKKNGELIPYKEVVKRLSEDTISISANLGFGYKRFFCSSYAQVMCLHLMVEEEKYERSVQWVRDILFQIHIEPSRIKSTANKMITDVPVIKESGSSVVKSMIKNLIFRPDSNHWTSSVFRQNTFLLKLVKQLEDDPDTIITKLDEIRNQLFKPENMVVHLALNLESLKTKTNPEEVWIQKFLPSTLSPSIMSSNFKKCCEYLQPFSGDSEVKGVISGLGSVESSFLIQTVDCCVTRSHPDYAPLMLLNNYLCMAEGPMWNHIRGSGLAYGYGIWQSSDVGLCYFTLYRSSNLAKAFKLSMDIVNSHLNGTIKWDMLLLDSSRAQITSQLIEDMKTISDVISQSVLTYCRGQHSNFTKELQEILEKISKVTTSDMERVGKLYLLPLFDPERSRCAVTCNPNKVDDIVKEFNKFSKELTAIPLDDSFMSKY